MAIIGFIGLGNMGGPMSAHLVNAGHAVQAYDMSVEALARAEALGVTPAGSIAEAVQGATIIVSMLPAGSHVRSVYLDSGGILASAAPGTLLIDSSTIDVPTAREVAGVAVDQGFEMVDAPVSGGVAGAEAASLTFMVGGTERAFEQAAPILEAMGKNIFHAGPAGNGQAAKVCNNMLLAISMIGVSEAFVLAEGLGLDPEKLFDIASTASGQCWSLTSYCPVPGPVPAAPSNRDFQPGFTARMMLKDLHLSQEAAQTSSAVTPLGAAATQLYERFDSAGHADLDFSGIIGFIREQKAAN